VKLNAKPTMTLVVALTSSKNKKPAYVNPTSFKVPARLMPRGPLVVTVRIEVIVMRMPQLPETRIMARRPSYSGFGLRMMSDIIARSP